VKDELVVVLMREGVALTMVGRMYVKAPVNSNMMTTTETVMCMIPDKAAAAPKKAYVPGVMHGISGWQAEKKAAFGNACWMA